MRVPEVVECKVIGTESGTSKQVVDAAIPPTAEKHALAMTGSDSKLMLILGAAGVGVGAILLLATGVLKNRRRR